VMRTVIVNSARDRLAEKRGGPRTPLTLSSDAVAEIADGEQILLAVHEALQDLEQVDARLAQGVEMRYFGGYSENEIAETLGVTVRTVRRDWEKARMLLLATLQ
jgi:RNA polymerase sigma factor (TIGR02999 family)